MTDAKGFLWTEKIIERAAGMWRAGQSREKIAEAVGCSPLQLKYFLTKKDERFPPRRVVIAAQKLTQAEIDLISRLQGRGPGRKTIREIFEQCNANHLYASRPWSFDRFVRARSEAVMDGAIAPLNDTDKARRRAKDPVTGTGLSAAQIKVQRMRLQARCLTCGDPTEGLYCEHHVRAGFSHRYAKPAISLHVIGHAA